MKDNNGTPADSLLLAYLAVTGNIMAEIWRHDTARRELTGPLDKLIRELGRQVDRAVKQQEWRDRENL